MTDLPSRTDDVRDKLGVCQWFHYEARADLEQAVELLHELGVRHVRNGISWADFHRPLGKQWYDRQMQALGDFEVLLSVWHTPPSIVDENEYHLGVATYDGVKKAAWRTFRDLLAPAGVGDASAGGL